MADQVYPVFPFLYAAWMVCLLPGIQKRVEDLVRHIVEFDAVLQDTGVLHVVVAPATRCSVLYDLAFGKLLTDPSSVERMLDDVSIVIQMGIDALTQSHMMTVGDIRHDVYAFASFDVPIGLSSLGMFTVLSDAYSGDYSLASLLDYVSDLEVFDTGQYVSDLRAHMAREWDYYNAVPMDGPRDLLRPYIVQYGLYRTVQSSSVAGDGYCMDMDTVLGSVAQEATGSDDCSDRDLFDFRWDCVEAVRCPGNCEFEFAQWEYNNVVHARTHTVYVSNDTAAYCWTRAVAVMKKSGFALPPLTTVQQLSSVFYVFKFLPVTKVGEVLGVTVWHVGTSTTRIETFDFLGNLGVGALVGYDTADAGTITLSSLKRNHSWSMLSSGSSSTSYVDLVSTVAVDSLVSAVGVGNVIVHSSSTFGEFLLPIISLSCKSVFGFSVSTYVTLSRHGSTSGILSVDGGTGLCLLVFPPGTLISAEGLQVSSGTAVVVVGNSGHARLRVECSSGAVAIPTCWCVWAHHGGEFGLADAVRAIEAITSIH